MFVLRFDAQLLFDLLFHRIRDDRFVGIPLLALGKFELEVPSILWIGAHHLLEFPHRVFLPGVIDRKLICNDVVGQVERQYVHRFLVTLGGEFAVSPVDVDAPVELAKLYRLSKE